MGAHSQHFSTPELGDVSLHVLSWGDPSDPDVVLLHGGGANAHWWDHLAPALAAADHHVLALDFRGHGDSSYPEELVVGAFSDDLEALLRWRGSDDVVLVGHSMGAHVALDHASRHPATRAIGLLDLARGASKRSRRSARLALSLRRTYATHEEAVQRFRFLPGAAHVSEALRLSIAEQSVAEQEDGRFGYKFDPRWFGIASRPRPDLAAIGAPTLLMRGSESELLSRAGAEELLVELPNAELAEIDGAGHHVQLDRPTAVLHALQAFLARVRT